jgi:hypothetical protein
LKGLTACFRTFPLVAKQLLLPVSYGKFLQMSVAKFPEWSLRQQRAESSRLAWAFALSVVFHIAVAGTYQAGNKLGWWQNWHLPAWLQSPKLLTEILKKEKAQPPPTEIPLMFVEVNQAAATPEPPKNARYYSDKNSQAANPDANVETATPKIEGKQTQVPKTEDVPRAKAFPLQPALPAPPAKQPQEEVKPKPSYTPGDLALAKPEPTPRKGEGEAPEPKPRTVAEAKARLQNSQLAGEKMKQEGGVKRERIASSLDAIATPFGSYDAAIIAAVQNRWYDLLDTRRYARDRVGRVTLRFRLNSDGTISELAFVENTVDLALGLLCQSAIKDPSPYARWPADMRRLIGAEYREVTFTFYYN